jgi:hypothetical protein
LKDGSFFEVGVRVTSAHASIVLVILLVAFHSHGELRLRFDACKRSKKHYALVKLGTINPKPGMKIDIR